MNAMIQEHEHARLPAYEAACDALIECEKIDECKDWADKAAALASYAKQAMDDTLLAHARRIQLRAVNRMGELLAEIEPHPGARTDLQPRTGGGTRSQAQHDAGISDRQRVTALRVANVPRDQFEAAVESERPPAVTALSRWGVEAPKHPVEFQRATWLTGALRNFAEYAERTRPGSIRAGLLDHEVSEVLHQAVAVREWLSELTALLEAGS